AAIVYIPSDDIAWAIGDDACWIAPVSLSVTVDAEGNVVDAVPGDGDAATDATATQQLTGVDAARALARADGAVLFTDVPADVEPSTGREVTSDVVLAGLAYANGFSDSFIAQIQSLSLPSVDAITAYLDSGVEVSLGSPEDIATKERVVTRLLEQQQGVTYVNVRVPDNYTFRSAPAV
ncbi:MAG TPA: cell division protein FtsQ, partial [Candidatus Coprousia avicola]|nr:cell division protein FtsQ [Candidatus Coprousia avicola]